MTEQRKTEGSKSKISASFTQTPPEQDAQSSTPDLDLTSKPVESQTRSRKKRVEPWMKEEGWTLLFSHRELNTRAQTVMLDYTSKLLDRRVELRIMKTGTWVWAPDARQILELQQLASCRGPDHTVRRPFHTGQTSVGHLKGRPFGPPKQ